MPAEHFVVVARIARTHGLKGEVSVVPATETPLDFLVGSSVWFVPPPARLRRAEVRSVRSGPRGALVSFVGIDSIDSASALAGRELLAERSSLPPEWDADVDLDDRQGYRLVDPVHGDLGHIVDTIATGANDVWVLDGPFGEVLVPVIEDVVVDIDDDSKVISVKLLPGLLPEEESPR